MLILFSIEHSIKQCKPAEELFAMSALTVRQTLETHKIGNGFEKKIIFELLLLYLQSNQNYINTELSGNFHRNKIHNQFKQT